MLVQVSASAQYIAIELCLDLVEQSRTALGLRASYFVDILELSSASCSKASNVVRHSDHGSCCLTTSGRIKRLMIMRMLLSVPSTESTAILVHQASNAIT